VSGSEREKYRHSLEELGRMEEGKITCLRLCQALGWTMEVALGKRRRWTSVVRKWKRCDIYGEMPFSSDAFWKEDIHCKYMGIARRKQQQQQVAGGHTTGRIY